MMRIGSGLNLFNERELRASNCQMRYPIRECAFVVGALVRFAQRVEKSLELLFEEICRYKVSIRPMPFAAMKRNKYLSLFMVKCHGHTSPAGF